MKKLSNEELLAELEVPFPVDQVLWRVTNTANDRTRGQVVPYADPRAYTDRLNGLVSPQGWTRTYETVTMNNITRTNRNAEIVTGKILVTCNVTIDGLGTHSGTGEEWADENNAMTSAEAQAFKRACSCFGLGRYFYDFNTLRRLSREEQVELLKYSDLKDTKHIKGYIVVHRYKLRTAIVPVYHQTFWAYNGSRCRCCQRLFCFEQEDDHLYRMFVGDMAHAAMALDPMV